jgi:hypothetical protein
MAAQRRSPVPRRLTTPSAPKPQPALTVKDPRAAGIDIHDGVHWVAVPPDCDPEPVRRFDTFTADLETLADWLTACGVDTVAMESTGVSWIPLSELLERRGFQVFLVDARAVAKVNGRPKSDIHDCPWIQRSHSYGLLEKAFRPRDEIVVLRGFVRQRRNLIAYASRHIQHMQKALVEMNLKLTLVVSDIVGKTGMAIIKAILAGRRDPVELAKLRDERCQRTEEEIAKALVGNWREGHLPALKQAVELYESYHCKIAECDRAIDDSLKRLPNYSGPQILDSPGGLYLLWSSPAQPRPNSGSVDLTGGLVIEGLMGPILVIEPEIGRQTHHQFRNELIIFNVDILVFHTPPESLDEDVVPRTPPTVTAHRDPGLLQAAGVLPRRELRPQVGVEDLRLAVRQRLLRRLQTEPPVQGVRQPPRQDVLTRQ